MSTNAVQKAIASWIKFYHNKPPNLQNETTQNSITVAISVVFLVMVYLKAKVSPLNIAFGAILLKQN